MHHHNARCLLHDPYHASEEYHELPDPPIQAYHQGAWNSKLNVRPHLAKYSSVWQYPSFSQVLLHVCKSHQQYKYSCLRNQIGNTDASDAVVAADDEDVAPEAVEQSTKAGTDEGKFVFLEVI